MSKRSILVVDDDGDVRTMMCMLLSAEGYTAIGVADGEEALRRLRLDPPDLALIDLAMPRMSGDDLIQAMADDEALAEIRVAVMSGQTAAMAAEHAPQVIARLIKPVELDDLLNVVREFADPGSDQPGSDHRGSDQRGSDRGVRPGGQTTSV